MKKKKIKQKINKKMTFYKVINQYPKTIKVFIKYNMGCIGCSMANQETIAQGCLAHGIDPDSFIKELNQAVKK